MKDSYEIHVHLQCVVCGSDSDFEYDEDKSFIRCNKCNREYPGGYAELVELNQGLIDEQLEATKQQMANDAKEEILKAFKDSFRGNRFIKIR